jgi:hypothetical protein
MAFDTWFVNKTNAFTYIVCTFGNQGKRYGIKNSIASATIAIATDMQILRVTYAILI